MYRCMSVCIILDEGYNEQWLHVVLLFFIVIITTCTCTCVHVCCVRCFESMDTIIEYSIKQQFTMLTLLFIFILIKRFKQISSME